MKHHVDVIDHSVAYDGFFQVQKYRVRYSKFSGDSSGEVSREVFHRGDSAGVLLYDPGRDQVVLTEQFRIGAVRDGREAWLLEIIAGIVEQGETPEQVVRREAKEEAGCEVAALLPISHYYASPGGSDEKISLYCGRVDCEKVGGIHGAAHESEDIKVHVVNLDEALSMVENGIIRAAMPILALQWLALNRDRVRALWRS